MTSEQVEMFETDEASGNDLTRVAARENGAVQRYVLAGIGALAVTVEKVGEFRHERIEKGIDRLAERGEQVKERRSQALRDNVHMVREMAVSTTQQLAGAAVGSVSGIVRNTVGIADAKDLERLNQELDDINGRLDSVVTPVIE